MAETIQVLGKVPVNRGTYNSTEVYYKDNVVQFNNCSWYCKNTDENGITGIEPIEGSDWGLWSGIEVVQELGDAEDKVLSQNAVKLKSSTGELNGVVIEGFSGYARPFDTTLFDKDTIFLLYSEDLGVKDDGETSEQFTVEARIDGEYYATIAEINKDNPVYFGKMPSWVSSEVTVSVNCHTARYTPAHLYIYVRENAILKCLEKFPNLYLAQKSGEDTGKIMSQNAVNTAISSAISTATTSINETTQTSIDALIAQGYSYRSLITPSSTFGGKETEKLVYLATQAGTYANYNNFVVPSNSIFLFVYNQGTWSQVFIASTRDALSDYILGVPVYSQSTFFTKTGKYDAKANFTNVKAGTYKIIAYSDEDYSLSPEGFWINKDATGAEWIKAGVWEYTVDEENDGLDINFTVSGAVKANTIVTVSMIRVDNLYDKSIDAIKKVIIDGNYAYLNGTPTLNTMDGSGNKVSSESTYLAYKLNLPAGQYLLKCDSGNIGYNLYDGTGNHIVDSPYVLELDAESTVSVIQRSTTENPVTELSLSVTRYIKEDGLQEVEQSFERGTMNGAGTKVDSEIKVIASTFITPNPSKWYFVIFPKEYNCVFNHSYLTDSSSRYNTSLEASFCFRGDSYPNVRLAFGKKDDTVVDIDFANSNFKVYELEPNNSEYDISVAASDSRQALKDKADIVLDGTNDTDILRALVHAQDSINILMFGGTYTVTDYITFSNGQKVVLPIANNQVHSIENGYGENNMIYNIISIYSPQDYRQSYKSTKIVLSQDLQDSIKELDEEVVVLGVLNKTDELDSGYYNNIGVKVHGINIIGKAPGAPIVFMDFTYANYSMTEQCALYGWMTADYPNMYTTHEKSVGIRVGAGSNNGIQNYVKSVICYGHHRGVECCGEHFVFEDVLTHHCRIGFSFGTSLRRTNYEHPNVMIGCSIEACYRLMELGKYGWTTLNNDGVTTSVDNPQNTLDCYGLSTETSWWIPENEMIEDGPTSQITLPIKEIIPGLYRGHIDLDYYKWASPIENDGSCKNMEIVNSNNMKKFGSGAPEAAVSRQVGSTYYDIANNKMYVVAYADPNDLSQGTKWITLN